MTDKEQIIIDNSTIIDVTKCKYYNNGWCELPESRDDVRNKPCGDMTLFDCYFKELARKSQEFEQLQEKYEALKLENEEGYEIVDELKQECEELKEYLQANQSTGICETCAAKAILQNDKYHKALKEIDKVINNIFDRCLGHKTDGCTPVHNVCEELIKILDIINKAKENEHVSQKL